MNYVIVAGGCFWSLEDLLRNQDGVTSTKMCSGTEMATAQDVKMSRAIATDYQAEPS
ncbi:peptide-methionine (S)-S-oxide reductase [Vibrio metschnikovii]|nr:peptide-methionine (S)-S-oxide reductase [Vibrio metschnikovii]EKO3586808.1 peptide-methionine (S)-S-oxide reductase [Vibrio metschnikovii]EKO3589224.1 peptide-methionine (S)-S-oxide reductase [Vibrio metschnikovii]EKO3641066.1 peptide-methionine (S)-S-oxide reductase [Vibrio metschnikovii]EKO3696215.1 peptide-methionine (S)-S-oxide reductase [Vibrio metschnikovii]